jgi:hypothetical protein
MDFTQKDTDALVTSMLNYYLLVKCGALKDKNLGPQFLEAVREIHKKGIYILEN